MRTLLVTLAVVAVASARPDTGYGAPVEETYGAPAAGYDAPAASYDAPVSYEAPATGYDAPAYEAAAPASVDLTVILLPVLALIGLFLLFPTYVSLSTVRRKRETGEDEDVASDVINRIQGIYEAVVQSEECIETIACNAGALARDVGISPALTTSAMLVTPKKYAKYAKQFAMPADCSKLKCGKLF